jgi:hypothetical protein
MGYIGNNLQQQVTQPATDFFSGTGSATSFTLTRTPTSVYTVEVVVNNVQQNPQTSYYLNGNTLIFFQAPPSGSNNIYVVYNPIVAYSSQPGYGTVGSAQLAGGAITPTVLDTASYNGTGAITVPSGTTAQRPTNSQIGMLRLNLSNLQQEMYNGVSWVSVGTLFVATGGQIIDSGSFRYHVFTQSGTFTVTTGTATADVLIVAGGGSATGGDYSTGSGGG